MNIHISPGNSLCFYHLLWYFPEIIAIMMPPVLTGPRTAGTGQQLTCSLGKLLKWRRRVQTEVHISPSKHWFAGVDHCSNLFHKAGGQGIYVSSHLPLELL